MIRSIAMFTGGFVVGLVALAFWRELRPFPLERDAYPYAYPTTTASVPVTEPITISTSTSVATTHGTSSVSQATSSFSIMVATQSAGTSVLVESVSFPVSGWITIHEIKNGVVGNVLGTIRRDAGEYRDVSVPLLRGTIPGGAYRLTLYADNGDRGFSLVNDMPILDASGQPMSRDFNTQ